MRSKHGSRLDRRGFLQGLSLFTASLGARCAGPSGAPASDAGNDACAPAPGHADAIDLSALFGEPSSVLVRGAQAYVADLGAPGGSALGRIVTVPLAGGPAVVLSAQETYPTALSSDDTALYWVNYLYDAPEPRPLPVRRLRYGQSAAETIATLTGNVASLTMLGGNVIYGTGGRDVWVLQPGGTPRLLSGPTAISYQPYRLGDRVAWLEVPSPTQLALMVADASLAVSELGRFDAPARNNPLRVDSQGVYVTDTNTPNALLWLPLDGSPTRHVTTDNIVSLTTTQDAIVWLAYEAPSSAYPLRRYDRATGAITTVGLGRTLVTELSADRGAAWIEVTTEVELYHPECGRPRVLLLAVTAGF